MANYEIVDGMRKGSQIYVHENNRYSLIKKYENHVRLRCSQYKSLMCPGTAVIKGDRLTIVKEHNHQDDESEILIMRIKNNLKKAVREGTEKVRSIYDTVMGTYPDDVKESVPWHKIKSILYSIRQNMTPADPDPEPVLGNLERCKVCLDIVEKKWTFVPCGHYPFCDGCSGIIVAQKLPCPICRQSDVLRLRLYGN